jgi:hypothetical protein
MGERRERFERQLEREAKAANRKDTLFRRVMARIMLLFFGCAGLIVGMVGIFISGILMMGGTKLLSDIWERSNDPFFFFGLFSVVVGGTGGLVLGMLVWDFLMRKTDFITHETRRALWRS